MADKRDHNWSSLLTPVKCKKKKIEWVNYAYNIKKWDWLWVAAAAVVWCDGVKWDWKTRENDNMRDPILAAVSRQSVNNNEIKFIRYHIYNET